MRRFQTQIEIPAAHMDEMISPQGVGAVLASELNSAHLPMLLNEIMNNDHTPVTYRVIVQVDCERKPA